MKRGSRAAFAIRILKKINKPKIPSGGGNL